MHDKKSMPMLDKEIFMLDKKSMSMHHKRKHEEKSKFGFLLYVTCIFSCFFSCYRFFFYNPRLEQNTTVPREAHAFGTMGSRYDSALMLEGFQDWGRGLIGLYDVERRKSDGRLIIVVFPVLVY